MGLRSNKSIILLTIVTALLFLFAGCNKTVVESSENNLIATAYDGFYITVNSDGSVNIVGEPDETYDFSDWRNIKSVVGGPKILVGLKKDGTVVATGNNETGACEVEDWRDIQMVAATMRTTYGLKKDGTIMFTGENDIDPVGFTSRIKENVINWRDIVFIDASILGLAGITSDGEILIVSENEELEKEVSNWKDISSISIEFGRAIGLKNSGEVLICELPEFSSTILSAYPYDDFNGAVKISAGSNSFACLMPDGTVKAISGLDTPEDFDYSVFHGVILNKNDNEKKPFKRIMRQRGVIDIECEYSNVILLKSNGEVFVE